MSEWPEIDFTVYQSFSPRCNIQLLPVLFGLIFRNGIIRSESSRKDTWFDIYQAGTREVRLTSIKAFPKLWIGSVLFFEILYIFLLFKSPKRKNLWIALVSKVVCLGHVSKQNHWPPMTKSWDQPGKECRLSPELFWQRTAANDCDHRGELGAVALLSFFPASKFDHAALNGATGIRELSEWHAGCACILRQGEAARTLCQRASAAMVSRVESAWQLIAPERFWLTILSTWRWLRCHQTTPIYNDTLQFLYPRLTLEDVLGKVLCRSPYSPVERSVETWMAL